MHMTYYQNPWRARSLSYFTKAFQLQGDKVSFTPSSMQVHVMIHLIIEAEASPPHSQRCIPWSLRVD